MCRTGSCSPHPLTTAGWCSMNLSSGARALGTSVMPLSLHRATIALALLVTALCAWPASLAAQTLDPTQVVFAPSPDHTALGTDGAPLVSRYDLGFYMPGAAAPFQVASMGKPAPSPSDGQIYVPLASLGALPSPGVIYEAHVSAVGPGGAGTSTASNTFMWSVPCSYTVSPLTQSAIAGAGTASVTVTAGTGCAWTATTTATWITITSGASGSGNGSVAYSIAANTSTTSRTATLTVAGQAVTVTAHIEDATGTPTAEIRYQVAGPGAV